MAQALPLRRRALRFPVLRFGVLCVLGLIWAVPVLWVRGPAGA